MKSLNVAVVPVAFMSSGQGIEDSSPNLRDKVSNPINESGSESMRFLLVGVRVIGRTQIRICR